MTYLVLSWDISASNPTWGTINELLLNVLKPFTYHRPVNTFYLVKVASELQRRKLITDLQSVAQSAPVPIHFVTSPIYQDGGYDGWLEPSGWPKVQAIAGI